MKVMPGRFFYYICGLFIWYRLNRERIISLLLLLCFAVIPAHGMVPHVHHNGVTNPLHGDSCPAGNHDHAQSQGKKQPAHCHAFNEISFYKQAIPGLSKPSEMPVLYAYIASPRRSECDVIILSGTVIPRPVVYTSRHLGNANAIIGPPSSC